jgi:hypothetical protein
MGYVGDGHNNSSLSPVTCGCGSDDADGSREMNIHKEVFMPGGDRTGPRGLGPMTGRATGYCAGFAAPGYANPGSRAGFWCRRGGAGRGWRNQYYETGLTGWQRGAGWQGQTFAEGQPTGYDRQAMSHDQKLEALRIQAEHMQTTLETILKQIEEIESRDRKDVE